MNVSTVLFSVLTFSVSVGFSDTLALFKPSDLTAQVAARTPSLSDGLRNVWNFSDTEPLFNGSPETGTRILGGMRAEVTVGPLTSVPAISPQSDKLVIGATGGSGYVATIQGVLLWDKMDFTDATGGGALVFGNSGESLVLRTDLFRNFGSARWVLRDGTDYYVSDKTFTGTAETLLKGTDEVLWANWDPSANGGADFHLIPEAGFSGRTFTNITAAGVCYSQTRTADLQPLFTLNDMGFEVLAASDDPADSSLLFAVTSSSSPASPFDAYNCQTGIVYKTVKGESLDMVFFHPSVERYERRPLVLYTHGGGWGGGDKTAIFRPESRETLGMLLENGIAVATIEYRLTRRDISTAYDCVVDCKDAGRFLVKHADEYGIDTNRMATWGGSAGGHLCLMTALAPGESFPGNPELAGYDPQFRCSAAYFPVSTFIVPEVLVGSNFENPNRFVTFLGGPYEENIELARLLSPAEHLTAASPPVLLLHGDQDQVISHRSSTYFIEVAAERGAQASLITVTNGVHGFGRTGIEPSLAEINVITAEFIINRLTD